MRILKTATGKEFSIEWDGVSFIDLTLRFLITDSNMDDVLATFTKPEETKTLTRIEDGIESVYEGFVKFRGVDLRPNNAILVSLVEE